VTGKKHNTVHDAGVGDIIAVAKVDDFDTNHTLSSTAGNTVVKPTEYPQPSIYMSLHTEDKNEEDKLGTLVPKYIAGDPTINFVRNPETKQHVITAAGQMQVELLAQKLRNQNKIGVELVTPKVAYRETVTAKGEGRYRHKKQSGGRGQFAEVQMRLAPIERGKQYEFINSIFGGAVPSKFIPAVEKGIAEAMEKGIVAGYPVVDVSVELFDGQYHEVDSSEMAFKIASSMGFRQIARDSCKPILLEPIMDVSALIPESYMGDVMGDLNSRRGRVQGMDPVGKKQVIRAKVPLSEMYSYAADLRSITQGRGVFEMDFSHYDPVPHEIAEKIIAESKVEDEEE
jgi:elongation factor G